MNIRFFASLTGVSLAALAVADWPHWRGPACNGASTATNLPATFSRTENVRWAADLPGPSAATPVVWRQHVFVSSTDRAAHSLVALALDRQTGRERWRHQIAEGAHRDDRSNFASPSPVTDGGRVIFFYGQGDLAAFDFAGRRLWQRSLAKDYGEFAFLWTYGASPLLHDGRLYIQVLQRDVPVNGRGRPGSNGVIESYLLALDPATGRELWRHGRPSDAVAESRESYASPVPFTHAERAEILVAGGDCITGHDPATGAELWRWGTWNPKKIGHWRLVPSPVAGDGVILACAPKNDPIYALQAGGQGRLADTAILWKSDQTREVTSDVPTPLFYLGDFFVLSDLRKALARVAPRTGRVKWLIETPGNAKYEASPTGADGRIYLLNFRGDVVVVDAADGRVLHRAEMGEPGDDLTRSTVVAVDSELFIRTNRKLYCVAAP
jgi:outer membrane protein assembly factor BamB